MRVHRKQVTFSQDIDIKESSQRPSWKKWTYLFAQRTRGAEGFDLNMVKLLHENTELVRNSKSNEFTSEDFPVNH